MFDTVLGIPVHALVVHAVVVLAPLTALLLLLFGVSARFRAWSGVLTPVVATLTTALTPVATQSGEALQRRVPDTGLVEEHAEMGDTLVWVMIAATIVAWAAWWFFRRSASGPAGIESSGGASSGSSGPSVAQRALAVLCVVAAVGVSIDVVLVGHSGAKSVWSDVAAGTPRSGGDGD
ncbi:MAG: DUF2231 domain-containing protein [Ornithinibacter sp.]